MLTLSQQREAKKLACVTGNYNLKLQQIISLRVWEAVKVLCFTAEQTRLVTSRARFSVCCYYDWLLWAPCHCLSCESCPIHNLLRISLMDLAYSYNSGLICQVKWFLFTEADVRRVTSYQCSC